MPLCPCGASTWRWWALATVITMEASPAAAASPKQHRAPLASETAYRPASEPYSGATNDAIDLTCAAASALTASRLRRNLQR